MISLDKVQDMVQKLKAQGLEPKTIVLCKQDADKFPEGISQLYGLNVVRADNYPESIVSPHVFEKVKLAFGRK